MLGRRRNDVGESLLTRSRRRHATFVAPLVVLASLSALAVPARAEVLLNGTCTMDITISFSEPPFLLTTAGYSISINGATSSCKTLPFAEPFTSIGGGSAGVPGDRGVSLSKCGVLAGNGTWDQALVGEETSLTGTHVLAGSWLGAAMVITSLSNPTNQTQFTGVIALVPADPTDVVTKLRSCANADPTTSYQFHMTGYEIFNDPDLSQAL